ncbi:MAG: TIGR04211 family SH3 domain-containing protein [Deltaproteobacteria bacterium]|jgi:SH3 domain protein|nr:TIGR04211 family SH3 domain-containing protein [Deltaproteobacteria bacterium]
MPEPNCLEPTPRESIRRRSGSAGAVARRAPLALAAAILTALLAAPGSAQEAWVMDKEVNLTLRTGAGTQYRIIGSLKTGDVATILTRGDGWTKVRTADGKEGWVSAGFLQASPPAQIQLERLERDADELRRQLDDLSEQTTELLTANEEIETNDEKQRQEIERLTRENFELRAGARWPEWITGAGIVLVGMALGALLGRNAGRRRQPRVRL